MECLSLKKSAYLFYIFRYLHWILSFVTCRKFNSLLPWKKNLKHDNKHFNISLSAPAELDSIIQEVKYRTGLQSAKLLRQLKRRDRLCHKLQKNYDIITACLQAVSQKRRKKNTLLYSDFTLKCIIHPPKPSLSKFTITLVPKNKHFMS